MEKDVGKGKPETQPEEGGQPGKSTGASSNNGSESITSEPVKAESGNNSPKPKNGESGADSPADSARKASSETPSKTKSQTTPKADSAKKSGGGFRRFLFWLLVLVLLAAGGYAGWIFYGKDQFDELKQSVFGKGSTVSGNTSPATTPVTTSPVASIESNDLAQKVESKGEAEASSVVASESEAERSDSDEISVELGVSAFEEVAEVRAALDALSGKVADNRLQLDAQQDRLRQLATTTREDWLLSEAEYLLRLANQRILTERQTRNALALLLTVDDILKELDQPDLFAVRKSLARDITSLKMAGVIDREGLYLRLDALISSLPGLDAPQREKPEVPAESPADQPWYSQLAANAWNALVKMSGIVRVERVDQPLDPVLLPTEAELLRLNLRLALEQSQLALMREQQAIYEASLQKARDYVSGSFENTAAVAVFVEELDALASEQVTQPLPLLGETIKALQAYIHRWHNRFEGPAEAAGEAEGEYQ